MKRNAAGRVARLGLLFALAIALSFLESLIPLPLPVPGVRLGLSNIVVMYTLFFCGRAEGALLGCLKSVFVLLTRGPVAGLLSLSGGMLAILAILLICKTLRDERYNAASVGGALTHNLGQLAVASLLLGGGAALLPFVPLLAFAGIAVGVLTAASLRAVLPALQKISG